MSCLTLEVLFFSTRVFFIAWMQGKSPFYEPHLFFVCMLLLWLISLVNGKMQSEWFLYSKKKMQRKLLHISIHGRSNTAHTKCKLMWIPAIYCTRNDSNKWLTLNMVYDIRYIHVLQHEKHYSSIHSPMFHVCYCTTSFTAKFPYKLNWCNRKAYRFTIYHESLVSILYFNLPGFQRHITNFATIWEIIPPELIEPYSFIWHLIEKLLNAKLQFLFHHVEIQ